MFIIIENCQIFIIIARNSIIVNGSNVCCYNCVTLLCCLKTENPRDNFRNNAKLENQPFYIQKCNMEGERGCASLGHSNKYSMLENNLD